MDGLFHGKPYEQMDDLGAPLFLETSIYFMIFLRIQSPPQPNRIEVFLSAPS